MIHVAYMRVSVFILRFTIPVSVTHFLMDTARNKNASTHDCRKYKRKVSSINIPHTHKSVLSTYCNTLALHHFNIIEAKQMVYTQRARNNVARILC